MLLIENGNINRAKLLRNIIVLAVALVLLISFWPFRTVPTGSRGVLTQFGAIKKIEPEGLVVVPPWQSLALFSIRAEEAQIDEADGSTSDTQPVKVSLTVRYSIQTDRVSEVYEKYSHNGDLSSYVQTATQEVFKAVTARYSAPDLIAKRSQVSVDINLALKEKLNMYGAQVINIDMRNFSFSDTYMHAINEKVTQEQLRLAAENKVRTVEAEQRAKVVTAQADADALKAQADGEAYATVTAANAQAEALRAQSDALAKSKDVLELRRIEVEKIKAEKWNGELPQHIYANAPIPFLALDGNK
ncbi:prohibitin family protein [Dyella japonica]|uniref:Band 7 protein n=1 Tax=Dyella japonica DSM 16301 TaxID=1440762 RepID=A0A0G9GXV5_9GAMM|nr:prohibitin family protein [Dyella japonica]KLD62400.1 band 7 protein [Dyella japonica DSM 16301]